MRRASGCGKQDEIWKYHHMSNHYRRILNVKNTVDTSLPTTYKLKTQNNPSKSKRNEDVTSTSRKECCPYCKCCNCLPSFPPSSPVPTVESSSTDTSIFGGNSLQKLNQRIIDEITFGSEMDPVTYCKLRAKGSRSSIGPSQKKKNTYGRTTNVKANLTKTENRRIENQAKNLTQSRVPNLRNKTKGDVIEKYSEKFVIKGDFQPRILKTEAESKLRNLHVYHPPRRKIVESIRNNWLEPEEIEAEEVEEEEERVEVEVTKETADKSTGGYTEDWNWKENESSKPQSQTSSRDSAYNGGVSSVPESRSPTPDQRRKLFDKTSASASSNDVTVVGRETVQDVDKNRFMNEAAYIKFLEEITDEILQKELYTNHSVEKIIKKHVKMNKDKLDNDRMTEAIKKLRERLDMSEETEPEVESILRRSSLTTTITNIEQNNNNYKNKEIQTIAPLCPCVEREQDGRKTILEEKTRGERRDLREKRRTSVEVKTEEERMKLEKLHLYCYIEDGPGSVDQSSGQTVGEDRTMMKECTDSREISEDICAGDSDEDLTKASISHGDDVSEDECSETFDSEDRKSVLTVKQRNQSEQDES